MTDSDIVEPALDEWEFEGTPLPVEVAQIIAKWWQSPGAIGNVLAAFASRGADSVNMKELQRDIQNTIAFLDEKFPPRELQALLAYTRRH